MVLKKRGDPRCVTTLSYYIAANIKTTDPPPITDPELKRRLPPNRGEQLNDLGDGAVRCANNRCTWITDPPTAEDVMTVYTVAFSTGLSTVPGQVFVDDWIKDVPDTTCRQRVTADGVAKIPLKGRDGVDLELSAQTTEAIESVRKECEQKADGASCGTVFALSHDFGSEGRARFRCAAYASASAWRSETPAGICAMGIGNGTTIGEARAQAVFSCIESGMPGRGGTAEPLGCRLVQAMCAGTGIVVFE